MRLLFIFLLFLLSLPLLSQTINEEGKADSIYSSGSTPNIRGTVGNQTVPQDKFRSFLNYLFFIPRKTIDGILYSSVYGARMIWGAREIERADEYFLKTRRKLVWYPIVVLDSDLRINAGIHFLYRRKRAGLSFKGDYTSRSKWESEVNLTYLISKRHGVWKVKAGGIIEEDDDRKFYGIGPNPMHDERSFFVANPKNEYGIYSRRRNKIEMIFGYRPAHYWEFFLSTQYQERKIRNEGYADPLLGEIFMLTKLPGADQDTKQWYNEFAVRFDSRRYRGRISKGLMTESFIGLSTGQGEDSSKFRRAGFDIAAFIPVLKGSRFLVPRIMFEMIDNVRDEVPIPFVEYPRMMKFRGVGHNKTYRTDKLNLLPSIEYVWPLSGNLSAHLFNERLIVGSKLNEMSIGDGVWAAGFGIDFHNIEEELVRIELITGSDGYRVTIELGLSNYIRRNVD